MELILIILMVITTIYITIMMVLKNDTVKKAEHFERSGNIREALKEYKNALIKEPSNVHLNFRVASIHMRQNEYAEAAVYYQKTLDLNKFEHSAQKEQIRRDLAICYFHTKKFVKSFKGFRQLEDTGSTDAYTNYYLGTICLKMGVYEAARNYLEKAHNSMTKSYTSAFNLAVAEVMNENPEKSLHRFDEAASIKPGERILKLLKGMGAYFADQPLETRTNLIDFVEEESNVPQLRYLARRTFCFSLIKQGKLKEAEFEMQKLVDFAKEQQLDEALEEILFDSGFLQINMDNRQNAMTFWQQLNKTNPEYPGLSKYLDLTQREINGESRPKSNVQSERDALLVDPEADDTYMIDFLIPWKEHAITTSSFWNYTGLKENKMVDITPYLKDADNQNMETNNTSNIPSNKTSAAEAMLDAFSLTDRESFARITRQIIEELGYKILSKATPDNKSDLSVGGADFIIHPNENKKEKTLFQAHKTNSNTMGDVPLKNLLGLMPELKCQKGILLTTAHLSVGAELLAAEHPDLRIITGDELKELLLLVS